MQALTDDGVEALENQKSVRLMALLNSLESDALLCLVAVATDFTN